VHSLTLWNNSVTGGKEIKRLTRKVKEECESVVQPMTLAKHTVVTDMKSRIEALTQVGEKMSNNITKLKEEISTAKKKLDAFRKLRKVTHSSVYNGIERILKEHKIVRASYHGGDFNGVNIITLMQESQDIMDEIKVEMVTQKPTMEVEINKLCVEVRKALVLWDDVFSKQTPSMNLQMLIG